MKAIVQFLAIASVLASCAAPVKPIVINRAQVVQSGALAVRALEDSVSDYRLPISADQMEKLKQADADARAAIERLNNSAAIHLPEDAKVAATALRTLQSVVPAAALPPAAEAALIAFTALAEVIAQTAPQAVSYPATVTPPPPQTTVDEFPPSGFPVHPQGQP